MAVNFTAHRGDIQAVYHAHLTVFEIEPVRHFTNRGVMSCQDNFDEILVRERDPARFEFPIAIVDCGYRYVGSGL